jgi:S1-C subfamily serine protease
MNMIVPIGLLPPILDDLLTLGRINQPPRPWLGVYVMEGEGGLIVGGLADGGPAERAGVRAGDRITGFGDEDVSDLATLWRRLWGAGAAGSAVRLRLSRDGSAMALRVTTADRAKFLRSPRLH